MQNNDSVPDQARHPTAVNSSGLQRTAIAVLITALIFGAGGYLLGQRISQTPTQGNQETSLVPSSIPTREPSREPSLIPFVPKSFYPVPTTDPVGTANWKTYKSDKYGFSLRYPLNRYVDMYPYPTVMSTAYPDDIVLHTKEMAFDKRPRNDKEFALIWEDLNSSGQNMVLFRNEPSSNVFFSWSDEEMHKLHGNDDDFKDEGIVIGGRVGRSISSSYKSPLDNKTHHTINIDIPFEGTKHLIIKYNETVITLDDFNQMLSTFKFIDQH